jgi:hypothetical protein
MFELNLYLTLKKHNNDTRKMSMNIKKNNPVSRSGLGLVLTTTYQNNKAIKEVGPSKVRSIPHCETNQCHGFSTQVFRFYENQSYVSCFLVGTLTHIYHPNKNPWSPSTYWSWWWTWIWNEKHFGFKDL